MTSSIQKKFLPGKLQDALNRLKRADSISRSSLNLVPSETRMSPLASQPLSTDFYNRYFFNQDARRDFWQFRGGQEVYELETWLAVESIQALSRAEYVNVRPISGLTAMLVAIAGLGGDPGGCVVSIDEASGGHYATRSLVERLGHRSIAVTVKHGRLDAEEFVDALERHPVSLVYLDLQNSLELLDVQAVADLIAAHSPRTLLHVDCSHTLGLVFGGAVANPLECGADSIGGSTHKSFPGPQKGVLCTNNAEVDERLRAAQFHLISSHHFAETLCLGLAAAEFQYFGERYASAVITNARALGESLKEQGFKVAEAQNHVTNTHQVWMDPGSSEETLSLSERLFDIGIRVNVQSDIPGYPGDTMRLGVNEITFMGATDLTMRLLSGIIRQTRSHTLSRGAVLRDLHSTFDTPYYFPEAAS